MRLIFITGKGGVGKSTVTATLAMALASLKCKTAIVELNQTRMADFFESPLPDYDGIATTKHLTLFNFDSATCFEEYAARQLPKHLLFFLKNRWVHHFIDAVPGLNEILFLGKIYAMVEEKQFDFLLIDAPATGHTLSLCDAPQTALKAIKGGALKTTLENILNLLRDPDQTQFLLVTQLEELIVQETIELASHLGQKLKLNVEGVVVNGVKRDYACPPAVWRGLGTRDYGPEAKPLVEVLKFIQQRRQREEKLLVKLKKEVGQKLILDLKPWVLQNLLKKNG